MKIYLKKVKNPHGRLCMDFHESDEDKRQICFFYKNSKHRHKCDLMNMDEKCKAGKYHYIQFLKIKKNKEK